MNGQNLEAWLRGEVDGVPTQLQPVAHALLQAQEEVERAAGMLDADTIWRTPGGAASIGYHILHMCGSLDRLLTYARGEPLSPQQREALEGEKVASLERGGAELVSLVRGCVARALEQLRSTPEESLDDPRSVGRAAVPSSVRGLLYHAGEHSARHAGQVITTARILRGAADRAPRRGPRDAMS